MIRIEISNLNGAIIRYAQLPVRWDQFSRKQAKLAWKQITGSVPEELALARLLNAFLDLPMKLINQIGFDDLYYLRELIGDIFNKVQHQKSFMPILWLGPLPLIGPGKLLKNFSAGRFTDAITLLGIHQKNESNQIALNQLMACLYIWPWQRHNSNKIPLRSWKFRLLPYRVKQRAILNFIGLSEYLHVVYPTIGQSDGNSDSASWNSILVKLPGDAFGTIPKRTHVPLHDMMIYLEEQAKEAKRIKKSLKNGHRN
jgi:hypothetical protein